MPDYAVDELARLDMYVCIKMGTPKTKKKQKSPFSRFTDRYDKVGGSLKVASVFD